MEAWLVLVATHLLGLASAFPVGLEVSAEYQSQQFLTGLVGLLLTVCAVVFLAGCLCCHRRNGFKEFHNNPVVASNSSILDHGHINPVANGEFTIFTPLTPPHFNNNVFLANQQVGGLTDVQYSNDADLRLWFDGSQLDFPRTKLKYIREIGKGWFGRVVEGTAQDLKGNDSSTWIPVAVRILESSATSSERATFLHDAIIYRCGEHPNILKLLGRSLETVPMLILQELCPQEDLKKYLRNNKSTVDKLLNSDLPLMWCSHLSSALKHLHDHKLTHPDLAARNCQLTSDLTLKLGDYGLAASLYPEDYYQGAPAVPVRWCAPESLTHTCTTLQPKKVTFEGNVWSLGVVFWEIYECGTQPYCHLSDDDVVSQVLDSPNVRLERPKYSVFYIDYLYRLMQLCWSTSESRPSVSQVCLMLNDLLEVYQRTKSEIGNDHPVISHEDFDRRWETLKPNSLTRTDNFNFEANKEEAPIYAKAMSPSLNNLHGSLDNIADGNEMDSWLQDVASKTGDMSYVRGISEAIQDLDNALALENVSSSESSHQTSPAPENLPREEATTLRNSSESETETETEDETWRKKVECGAYSEKVRQKSKSVTDLMVLTHIDYSESDSETPNGSFVEPRGSFRRKNCDATLNFGSEGNLLSVQETFQEELRKLQEERKDSLLFVPEKSTKALLEELSSPSEIQPETQVYNVFSCVVVDQTFSPVRLRTFQVPKLSEIIQNNDDLMDYIIAKYDVEDEQAVDFDVSDTQDKTNVYAGAKSQFSSDADDLRYSLESWDNFIGDAFTKQQDGDGFGFSSEPQSLLFLEEDHGESPLDANDKTFVVENDTSEIDEEGTTWQAGQGWFLHPQSDVAGEMDEPESHSADTESYVGFSMDDEVAAAIRNELITKLSQAQQANAEEVTESDDWSLEGRSEVNIKYNVPLSPIPEESCSENDSHFRTYQRSDSSISEDCDWPEPYECPESGEFPDPPESESHLESPARGQQHRHTPSQDSCCSNDTLFNLEELLCADGHRRTDKLANHEQNCTNYVTTSPESHDLPNSNTACQSRNSSGKDRDEPVQMSDFREGEAVTKGTPEEVTAVLDYLLDELFVQELENRKNSRCIININETSNHIADNNHESPKESDRLAKLLDNLEKLYPSESIHVPDSPKPKSPIDQKPSKPSKETENFRKVTQNFISHEMEHYCRLAASFEQKPICFGDKNEFLRRVDSFIRKEMLYLSNHSGDQSRIDTFKKPVEKSRKIDCNPSSGRKCNDNGLIECVEQELYFDKLHKSISCKLADSFKEPIEFTDREEFLDTVEDFLKKEYKGLCKVLSDSVDEDNAVEFVRSIIEELCEFIDDREVVPEVDRSSIEAVNVLETILSNVFSNNLEESPLSSASSSYVDDGDEIDSIDNDNFETTRKDFDYISEFIANERHHECGRDEKEESGALTDIRFSGPSDNQLMSTSFSESAELGDEHDWDSGSDTRSSSSGEFIWREGEHEESVKALRAAPQEIVASVDVFAPKEIKESSSSESEDSEEDDGDGPEFVPSAWDMYAIPGKSSLRSPEKTLEREDENDLKKSRGVWFKKQKYHCVYEYPREPESPVINTCYDLWQSVAPSATDWEVDTFYPSTSKPFIPQDEEEFFISSTSQPFECANISSEFFPGQHQNSSCERWGDVQNVTPDSGVEDAVINECYQSATSVPSLKQLATTAIARPSEQNSKESLGGLRHARNKLKLDLPPSPSAFTSGRSFALETERQVPTFTTFGKSRFQVQQVDTRDDDAISECRNVSFEALPYKPLRRDHRGKVEAVRGEASLLDSADEDSGIESSTLERKKKGSLVHS